MFRTYVVDVNRLSREGMLRLLADTPFEVVGHGGTLDGLEDAIADADGLDLLLIDVPREDVELRNQLSEVRAERPDLKIVVLTMMAEPRMLVEFFGRGVDGYLLKDISTDALVGSLNLIFAGERVFPSQMIPLILRGVPTMSPPCTAEFDEVDLSERELHILGCLVEGASNKLIANRLELSEATVKVHVKSILRKIKAQNRTQAAIWALNNGIPPHAEISREVACH